MIAQAIVQWYQQNKRDLPWRRTSNPYYIWISEIMLQQTRVDTVIPYYLRFIDMFPTIEDLAKANQDNLYKAWQGLGYYSRVKNMQAAANQIINQYQGRFPATIKELEGLKGIGKYTSRAIASIAFDEHCAAIDGNALRIFSRLYEIDENVLSTKTNKHIQELADTLIQSVDPSSFNQGLMDLGATICLPKSPNCSDCPLSFYCQSCLHHTTDKYPILIKKTKIKTIAYITAIITYQDHLLLIKNEEGLLSNLYGCVQYPASSIEEFKQQFFKDYHIPIHGETYIGMVKHQFTHRRWEMEVYHFHIDALPKAMYPYDDHLPISTAHIKVLRMYAKKGHC